MERFGATTVARWLSEEMPCEARAFIVDEVGELHELVGAEAESGRLMPRLRGPGARRRMYHVPRATRLSLSTPVILSMGENLAGKKLAALTPQVVRAAFGSFALPSIVRETVTTG